MFPLKLLSEAVWQILGVTSWDGQASYLASGGEGGGGGEGR